MPRTIEDVAAAIAETAYRFLRVDPTGLTLDLWNLTPLRSDKFAVAIYGCERQLHCLGPSDIKQYINDYHDQLFRSRRYLGIYFDEDRCLYVLDVVVVVKKLSQALELAVRERQKSIAHLETKLIIAFPWHSDAIRTAAFNKTPNLAAVALSAHH